MCISEILMPTTRIFSYPLTAVHVSSLCVRHWDPLLSEDTGFVVLLFKSTHNTLHLPIRNQASELLKWIKLIRCRGHLIDG